MSTRSDARVKAWFKSLSTRLNSRCECGANAITLYSYGEYSGGRFRRILNCCLRCYDRRVLPTLRQRAEELGRPVVPEGRAGTAIPPWMRGANPWDRRLEALPFGVYVSATRVAGEAHRGTVVEKNPATGRVLIATQEAVGSFWVSCDRVEVLPTETRPATSSRIPQADQRNHGFQVDDVVRMARGNGTGVTGVIVALFGLDMVRVRWPSVFEVQNCSHQEIELVRRGADPTPAVEPEPFPVGTVVYVWDDPEIHVVCAYDGLDTDTYRVRRLDGSGYTARVAELRRADPSLPDEPMQSDAVLLFAIGDTVAEVVNGQEMTVDSIGREDGVWLIRFSRGNQTGACRQHRLQLVRPLEQVGPYPRIGDLAVIRTGRMANARCRVEEVRPTGEVLVRPENGPRRLTYVARALEVVEVARPPEPVAAPVSVPSIPNWALALRRRGGVRPS